MYIEPDHGFRPPIPHDFSGETLGSRYHLDRRLGYGGMASIYAATCKHTGATFALKVLHPEHDDDEVFVQRFRQEAQLAAQIRHPNLIPAYDAGWLGGHHFIAMELVEGKTLSSMLADGRPLGWERSTAIVCDLLAGLGALHERGVAHRDISPNNCIVEDVEGRERARLSDLGYARVVDEAEGLTLGMPPESVPAVIYGTPYFIAPERLRDNPGDFRADIFSIGALWYAMLTGEALADPRNVDSVAVARRLDLPPALRAVLLGALEIRVRRHHSAASMAAAIHQALKDIHGRRQGLRRLGTFAPLLSLLAFPIWLALLPEQVEPACPEPQLVTTPVESTCPEPLAFAPGPATSEWAPLAEPDSEPVLAPPPINEPKPAAREAAATGATATSAPRERPATPRRFNLRRALAKCKPHPTAHMEITVDPGKEVRIDGDRPTGELGRCVEEVLAAHPPRRAETIKL